MGYKTIPTEVINNISNQVDIYSVISNFIVLSKKGNDYVGLCPFHSDNTPSLSVSPQKNIFKCFSCGVGGDSITFVKRFKNISYIESIEYLANQIGYNFDFNNYKKTYQSYSEDELESLEVLNLANNQYKLEVLSDKIAMEYLNSRGLTLKIREKFNIGFSPKKGIAKELIDKMGFEYKNLLNAGIINNDFHEIIINRITFGIENEQGKIVGFSGRSLDNQTPKYINSPTTDFFNKSNILYNYARAKKSSIDIKKEIIITEGFMDVIALYRSGITNVVSLMGTSFTKNHLKFLKNLDVVLFLDNDNAGVNASKKTIKFLLENKINVKVITNDLNKDPDEIFNTYGSEKLSELVNKNKKLAIDFIYELLVRTYNLDFETTSEKINEFVNEFLDYLQHYDDTYFLTFKNKIQKNFNIVLSEKNKDVILPKNYEKFNNDLSLFSPNFSFKPKKTNVLKGLHKTNLTLNTMIKYILESQSFIEYYSQNEIDFKSPQLRNYKQVDLIKILTTLFKKHGENKEKFEMIKAKYKSIFLSFLDAYESENKSKKNIEEIINSAIITQYNLDNANFEQVLKDSEDGQILENNKIYEQIYIKREDLSEKNIKLILSNLKKMLSRLSKEKTLIYTQTAKNVIEAAKYRNLQNPHFDSKNIIRSSDKKKK